MSREFGRLWEVWGKGRNVIKIYGIKIRKYIYVLLRSKITHCL